MEEKIQVKDLRNKQFFLIDNEFIDIYAKYLKPASTFVYLSLCRHANKDQKSWPGIRLICSELNLGKSSVIRGIKELEKLGMIKVFREKDKNSKCQKFNIYELLDKSFWKAKPGVTTGTGGCSPDDTTPSPIMTPKPGVTTGTEVYTSITCKQVINNISNSKELEQTTSASQKNENIINKILSAFYRVNRTIKFGNKAQRAAAERLVNLLGGSQTVELVEYAIQIFGKDYAPSITTPIEMEHKLAKLQNHYSKNKKINETDVSERRVL